LNIQSNAMPESSVESHVVAPAVVSATQPFYWSVRRELWENRSIYIAPVAFAGIFLFGFVISTVHLPAKMRAASALDPMQQGELIQQPFDFAALLLMGTMLIVAGLYCLDALHGERRDHSILFWKSLPVSDLTTVLSKASIPIVVLPLITFAVTIATQWIMLLVSSAVLLGSGLSAAALWQLPWFQMSAGLLFHLLAVHGFYYAPLYGWLLLLSGWARRAVFLWAGLPLVAIGVVEKLAFNTSHFGALLLSRLGGGAETAPVPMPREGAMPPLAHFAPLHFLMSPSLWIGLIFCAAFLAGAVRLRRYQGPI
jgi:ABC-2 type transport system permease protein